MKKTKCPCCFKKNPDPRGRKEAEKEAKSVLRKMKTPGWKIRLWHNMHWCWSLQNQYISVMGQLGSSWAMMSDVRHASGSPSFWCPPHRLFRDPNKAVKYVQDYAELFVAQVTRIVNEQQAAFRGVYARYEALKGKRRER
jgi:hypothetical protein